MAKQPSCLYVIWCNNLTLTRTFHLKLLGMALGFDTNENIREQSHKIDTTYNMIANFLLTFAHNWKELGRCFEQLCYYLTTIECQQDKVRFPCREIYSTQQITN